MSISKKFYTKSGLEKEGTQSRKLFKGLSDISGRRALSQLKTRLILKELKKSKITDRDIDISKRLHEQYPEYFSADPETTRRRISLARSYSGREKKANEFDKEQVIENAKQVIKNNPNVHNISWLAEQLRNQKLPNYSFNYLFKVVRDLKKFGGINL